MLCCLGVLSMDWPQAQGGLDSSLCLLLVWRSMPGTQVLNLKNAKWDHYLLYSFSLDEISYLWKLTLALSIGKTSYSLFIYLFIICCSSLFPFLSSPFSLLLLFFILLLVFVLFSLFPYFCLLLFFFFLLSFPHSYSIPEGKMSPFQLIFLVLYKDKLEFICMWL